MIISCDVFSNCSAASMGSYMFPLLGVNKHVLLTACLSVCALATKLFLQVQKSLLHCLAAQPCNQPYFLILGKWRKGFELHRLRHKRLCFLVLFGLLWFIRFLCLCPFYNILSYPPTPPPFGPAFHKPYDPTTASAFCKHTPESGVFANVCSLAAKFFSPRLRRASLLLVWVSPRPPSSWLDLLAAAVAWQRAERVFSTNTFLSWALQRQIPAVAATRLGFLAKEKIQHDI